MALDPTPAALGLPADPVVDEVVGPADDTGRLRHTAQRQWAARRDLERRLHDGAALRISALTLRLGLLQHRHPDGEYGENEFRVAVGELQDELHVVLQELRDIAGMLYPPLLDEAGLGPALREAAGSCPAAVRIDVPDERFGPDVEGAVYFAVLGCLPDDPACPVEIVVRREADDVVVLVRGAGACQTGGTDGVRLLGGSVTVGPAAGVPTITVRIPCA